MLFLSVVVIVKWSYVKKEFIQGGSVEIKSLHDAGFFIRSKLTFPDNLARLRLLALPIEYFVRDLLCRRFYSARSFVN